jgi:glycosyltransferase involved in cell wall biosynthesis
MRVGVATVQVPFVHGGAELLVDGLLKAIRESGHQAEKISIPFRFSPVCEVERSMTIWSNENWENMNGYNMDLVICLKFPTFYLHHPHKTAWIIHQHRAVYDLWNTSFTKELSQSQEGKALQKDIVRCDADSLKQISKVFTIAKTVSQRLQHFNQIKSTPLYHPPQFAEHFYSLPAEPYIFCPSRLESLKRQDLLIKAMKYVKSPVVALIAGDGGTRDSLQSLIDQLELRQRVRLIGRITNEEMLGFYAQCLGVFFGPYDEDYGYVTLESMLASKPVITCKDSGEPTEFVIHKETGLITEPDPEQIADSIDTLYFHQDLANTMGNNAKDRYNLLNISWQNVIQNLLY